ncbi:hypothetical protein RI129_006202 [Pyrocoelia pectoralis]|uniref:THAP-type domain-containing protein n=1 Tax=Pyrocoelia pectoralis TaxID=417401 RepID=A0AAN7ZJJ7_9COLE
MEPSKRCYKWCFVPMCTNTTFTTPEKTFVTMPRDVKIRKMWFKAARRDYSKITSSDFYCCENHFDFDKIKKNNGTVKNCDRPRRYALTIKDLSSRKQLAQEQLPFGESVLQNKILNHAGMSYISTNQVSSLDEEEERVAVEEESCTAGVMRLTEENCSAETPRKIRRVTRKFSHP